MSLDTIYPKKRFKARPGIFEEHGSGFDKEQVPDTLKQAAWLGTAYKKSPGSFDPGLFNCSV